MGPRNTRVLFAILASIALLLPAVVTAQSLVTYNARLSGSNTTYASPQFDLEKSVDNSTPLNGFKDAFVYLTLGTDTTWTSFMVTVGAQPGNSVTVEVLDSSHSVLASGVVSGPPITLQPPSSIQLVSGRTYTIHLEALLTSGSTSLVSVNITGKPAPAGTAPPPSAATLGIGDYWPYITVAAVAVLAVVLVGLPHLRKGRRATTSTAANILPRLGVVILRSPKV